MEKVLIAVDDTKGSVAAAESLGKLFPSVRPETVVLLYVEKMRGRSIIGDALESEPDMQAMREALEGTEYQEMLDQKANKIISYYKKILEDTGISGIKPVVKEGHPAEEILSTAKDEQAEMIIVGSRGGRRHDILLGSVSREVADRSHLPVLIAR